MKLNRDSILIFIMLLISIVILFSLSFIQFEEPEVKSYSCKKVTVSNLKEPLTEKLCEITIENEEIVDCFWGLFEEEWNEHYYKIKYFKDDTQYVYIMFPKGEIRIYELYQNNDFIYELVNSYSWEEKDE